MQGLEQFNQVDVTKFKNYVNRLKTEKDRNGTLKNPWAAKLPDSVYVQLFEQVHKLGLTLDGQDVIIKNQGGVKLDFTHQAYKNLVLIKYPETTFDIQLLHESDDFYFEKQSGKVSYNHRMIGALKGKPIVGGYAIIKNRTGEFIELMTAEDFKKIKSIAKTDYIWNNWESRMCLKSLMKRICRRCMNDVTKELDELDNENYDLDAPILEEELLGKIRNAKSKDELIEIYKQNKNHVSNINNLITALGNRKKELGL